MLYIKNEFFLIQIIPPYSIVPHLDPDVRIDLFEIMKSCSCLAQGFEASGVDPSKKMLFLMTFP